MKFISDKDLIECVKNVLAFSGQDEFSKGNKTNYRVIRCFHQEIFRHIADCHIPNKEQDFSWDAVFHKDSGIALPDGDVVHAAYVEMKNRHSTMNSPIAVNTYIKMQSQLLEDDDCVCFLVELAAMKSQNIKWSVTVDGKKISHRRIRLVSLDQFYALITGQEDALFHMRKALPQAIDKAVAESGNNIFAVCS